MLSLNLFGHPRTWIFAIFILLEMTVEARKRNKGGDKRQEAYISDRRQRISESFADAAENSEELKKSFDEWMKIVADNASSWTTDYLEN